MTRYLIINADDYGWDSNATNAILELGENAKITSTTVMSNLASSSDLEKLRKLKGISVGLHINLLEGRPLSPVSGIRSLVDENGFFLSQKRLLLKAVSGRISEKEVASEVFAQWELLQSSGITLSHADSHKHVHQYPVVGNYILNALKKIKVNKVRRCDVVRFSNPKNLSIKLFHLMTQRHLMPYITPDKLISDFSLYRSASFPLFERAIDHAFRRHNLVEFMTHPALENRLGSYLNRKAEFDFWNSEDVKTWLAGKNISLVNYNQITA